MRRLGTIGLTPERPTAENRMSGSTRMIEGREKSHTSSTYRHRHCNAEIHGRLRHGQRDSVTTSTSVDQVRFVAVFATDLLTGACLALMLAATGRETRQWIATQGRAARRRTGQLLHTEQLTAIIRRGGVLGLADRLRRTDAEKEATSTAQVTRHVEA